MESEPTSINVLYSVTLKFTGISCILCMLCMHNFVTLSIIHSLSYEVLPKLAQFIIIVLRPPSGSVL